MKVEYFILFYIAVCIVLILFACGFLCYGRLRDWQLTRKSHRLDSALERDIERNEASPTSEHRSMLMKKMKHLSGLESFDFAMEKLQNRNTEKANQYLMDISLEFEFLARTFAHKSDLHKAYFAYIVRRWYRRIPASKNIVTVLLRYVKNGSLYARQNALEALAQVGTPHALVKALLIVENFVDFHHPKLITEITMAYQGTDDELAEELNNRFDEFRPEMQAAIINFMGRTQQGDSELYFHLLQDEAAHKEVRLACMRYFAIHHDERVEPILQSMALTSDTTHWEYAAVAATVLGRYISDDTLATLTQCLSSPIWYVRLNASKSLYDACITLESDWLKPVLEGNDPFAQDMVRYRWELEANLDSESTHIAPSASFELVKDGE